MIGVRHALLLPLALAVAGCIEQSPPAPLPPPVIAPAPRAALPAPAFAFEGQRTQGGLVYGTAPRGSTAVTLDGRPVRVAADGRFLIAFDRDAGPTATVSATLADGTTRTESLQITPRSWDIQSLPTLAKGTTPTPEFLARRKVELARIEAMGDAAMGGMKMGEETGH